VLFWTAPSLLLPLDTQRIGEEEAFSLPFFYPFSLSQNPKNQRPDLSLYWHHHVLTQKGHALQRQGRLCSSRPHACHHALPWEDRAGWPSLPLPINTEGVQEKKGRGEEGSWNVFVWKGKWGRPRGRDRQFSWREKEVRPKERKSRVFLRERSEEKQTETLEIRGEKRKGRETERGDSFFEREREAIKGGRGEKGEWQRKKIYTREEEPPQLPLCFLSTATARHLTAADTAISNRHYTHEGTEEKKSR